MKKLALLFLVASFGLVLASCEETSYSCGTGTVLQDGMCVLESDVVKEEEPDQVNSGICTDNERAFEVVNGEFVNAPAEPWFFIGGWMVNDPDNIWIAEYDAIIFDVTDAALATRAVWDGAFWQPKVFTEKGYTYTVSFTLRTDDVAGRDVILFLEDTDSNYFKMIEETVTLTETYQTFSYEYVATYDNNDTKVGLFFANDVGTVIIDSILITRAETN